MANYRTSSLFHYTTFNGLKSILKLGIIPNFCKEDLTLGGNPLVITFPMVSFCDIPLTRTSEFTKRYGRHAIGLTKEWALRNNINPILYIHNPEIISSLGFFRAYEVSLRGDLQRRGSDGEAINIDLHDPDSVSSIASLVNHVNARNANFVLLGYSKMYFGMYKGKRQCNYEENEWRYVVKEETGIEWKWDIDQYNAWRGDPNDSKPESNEFLKSKTLKFEINDISYIIVEQENQRNGIINYIAKLPRLCELDPILDENAKRNLYSKIISMERIGKDF